MYVIKSTLTMILKETGSQCREARFGVMCEYILAWKLEQFEVAPYHNSTIQGNKQGITGVKAGGYKSMNNFLCIMKRRKLI